MKKYKNNLVPRLRFPEFRDSGEWEEKTVAEISSDIIAGGTPSTLEHLYWGGSIRWMNSGELNFKKVYEVKGRITDEGLKKSSTKLIPERCVLIGLAGQGKTRGTVAMNMWSCASINLLPQYFLMLKYLKALFFTTIWIIDMMN